MSSKRRQGGRSRGFKMTPIKSRVQQPTFKGAVLHDGLKRHGILSYPAPEGLREERGYVVFERMVPVYYTHYGKKVSNLNTFIPDDHWNTPEDSED